MTWFWIATGTAATAIVSMEASLWVLFSRRVAPIVLARELDTSSFGLWTIGRLRVFAAVHTVLLLTAVLVSLFALW